jgi:bleomycin hydrolase
VENSWGAKGEGAGYLSMEASWFDQYVYQIVVRKSRLSAADREALDSATPIVLPPWDPLGALAE